MTAICVSIDRFPQDTAPIRCLPFDGIGARYPAMTTSPNPNSSCRPDVSPTLPRLALFTTRPMVGECVLIFRAPSYNSADARDGTLLPAVMGRYGLQFRL